MSFETPRPSAPQQPSRRLPIVLATVLLAIGLVGFVPRSLAPEAYAAECPPFETATAVADADTVFHGRVTGAPKRSDSGVLSYPVTVLIPFKSQGSQGASARGDVTVQVRPGPCRGARLTQQEDYVFFLQQSGNRLVAPGGQPSVRPYSERLNQELHELQGGSEEEPEPVVFGEPAGTEPRPFTRLAAPGAALVVVGALGLLLVRRLSRR